MSIASENAIRNVEPLDMLDVKLFCCKGNSCDFVFWDKMNVGIVSSKRLKKVEVKEAASALFVVSHKSGETVTVYLVFNLSGVIKCTKTVLSSSSQVQ